MEQQLNTYLSNHLPYISAYVGKGDDHLIDSFDEEGIYKGVTLTAPGFYGPQGRNIRIQLNDEDYISKLMNCQLGQNQITNLEMETAGIYAMANALGHQAISLNALLANRKTGEFAKDPQKIVSELIDFALNKIINS
jgi:uridine phosphorylase